MQVSRSEAADLRAMIEGEGWAVFERALRSDLETKRNGLENPMLGPEKTNLLRGEIAAIRILMKIPAILIENAPADDDGDPPRAKSMKDYKR